ncbi:DUF2170 family protein [Escherichia coli]|nr:DUF2170 family protein [Escherichia coli]
MNLIPLIKKSEDDAVVIGRNLQRATGRVLHCFGRYRLNLLFEDILLEITSLVDNALDLAEITEEYSH